MVQLVVYLYPNAALVFHGHIEIYIKVTSKRGTYLITLSKCLSNKNLSILTSIYVLYEPYMVVLALPIGSLFCFNMHSTIKHG